MRRALWILGLGGVLWAHARADAQEAARLPLELTWQAPDECGTAEDVRAELERVAHALPGYALAPLRAQAQIDRQEHGYALHLVTEHEGEHGERRLEARDCPTLVRSMTLVLALAFGKGVELAEPAAGTDAQASPATAARTGAAPKTAETAPPATAQATPKTAAADSKRDGRANAESEPAPFRESTLSTRGPARFSVLISGAAYFLLMPKTAPYFGLGAELAGMHWSAALRANAWAVTEAQLAPDLSAEFGGFGATLQGCGHLAPAFFDLALCGTALGAGLRGRARGTLEDNTAWAPWFALGPLVSATIPKDFLLALRLEAGLALSLTRPQFVIEGYDRPAHRAPLVTVQLGLTWLISS